jgi:hypothetical protein
MLLADWLLGLTSTLKMRQRNPEGPTVTPCAVKAWNFLLFLRPFLSSQKETGLLNANPSTLGFTD